MNGDNTSTWIVILASIFDFLLVFIVGGVAIAYLTGASTEGGFRLRGLPALALFVLIYLYFWGLGRSGGTVFERLFGIV